MSPEQAGAVARIADEYIAARGQTQLEEFEADFDGIMAIIGGVLPISPATRIFEVGAGLGWFEVICAKRGLRCSAIEVNRPFRDAALALADQHGVDVDISLGSVEDSDIGSQRYDVIIATSVFEHVRQYGRGLARIYEALRPGGAFYFYSTNKFSLRSGEYPDFPLYGWWPYSVRERIRVARQGAAIVDSRGMDFNQFTHWGLARHFRALGYSRVLDPFEYVPPNRSANPSVVRRLARGAARSLPPFRLATRTFASGNAFLCIK